MFYKKRRMYGKRKWMGKSKRGSLRKRAKTALVTKPMLYRAIRRNVETKLVTSTYGITAFNGSIGQSGDAIVLLPNLVVGTGRNQRIGARVKPLKMTITGYVAFNGALLTATSYTQDAFMLGVRLFVYQNKSNPSVDGASVSYNLLELSNGTSGQFNTAVAYNLAKNTEKFKFYSDKKWVMNKPYGLLEATNGSGTVSNTGPAGLMQTIDRSMYRPFKIVLTQKHMPSVLTYDDTLNTSFPMNFNPLMSLGYVHLTQNVVDTTLQLICMSYVCTLEYEDA